MKVYVGNIRERPGAQVEFDDTVPCPEPDGDDAAALRCAGPMRVRGTVLNTGRELLVRGRLVARVRGGCSRCLSPVERRVEAELTERYVREGRARPRDGEDDPVRTYQGETISLDDPAREAFLLALPMKLLCREDCAGLCPRCGQNRNLAECGCSGDEIDPRLAALTRWRRDP